MSVDCEIVEILSNHIPDPIYPTLSVLVAEVPKQSMNDMLKLLNEHLSLKSLNLSCYKRVKASGIDIATVDAIVAPPECFELLPNGVKQSILSFLTKPLKTYQLTGEDDNWPIRIIPVSSEKKEDSCNNAEYIMRGFSAAFQDTINRQNFLVNSSNHSSKKQRITHEPFESGVSIGDPVTGHILLTSMDGLNLKSSSTIIACSCGQLQCICKLNILRSMLIQNPSYTPIMLCINFLSNTAPDSQYLCTGLDLFATHEPDIMDGMALVHARISRVFFCYPARPVNNAIDDTSTISEYYGAYNGSVVRNDGPIFRLHGIKELNHHYKVYRLLNPPPTLPASDIDNDG